MKKAFLLAAFFAATTLHAQSVSAIDDKIDMLYNNVLKYGQFPGDTSINAFDSLEWTNKRLVAFLMGVAPNNRALLTAESRTRYGFKVVASDDHKLKIYGWDTEEGGSMRAYNAVMQFESENRVYTTVLNDVSVRNKKGHFDYGSFYEKVISVQRTTGETIYLVFSGGIFGGGMGRETIDAFTLKGSQALPCKLFKSRSAFKSSISYDWDYGASINQGKNIDLEFKFGADNSILYVPFIKDNEEITDKYLIYKFNGDHFVYSRTGKP